jgi:hypothetical protein
MGTGFFLRGATRSERDVDHSPPPIVKFKSLTPELNPRIVACRGILLGILIFKGLTAR